ncbi:MAG: transcription-repair coupling factor [Holosporales bacterium]
MIASLKSIVAAVLSPLQKAQSETLYGVPEGVHAFLLGELSQACLQTLVHVTRHEAHLDTLAEQLRLLYPEIDVIVIPAWDCLPYDRTSPARDIVAKRAAALAHLHHPAAGPRLVLTSVSSILQRIPPLSLFDGGNLKLTTGCQVNQSDLTIALLNQGYRRVETVREPGEFAQRGGIVDLFLSTHEHPVRLDFFGDEIESLQSFDPMTQRSLSPVSEVRLEVSGEIILTETTISQFRQGYRLNFGAVGENDPLYAAISAGQSYPGMEHWMPLFYPNLATLFDALPNALFTLEDQALEACKHRLAQIEDIYQARLQFEKSPAVKGALPYHPLTPDQLYLGLGELDQLLSQRRVLHLVAGSSAQAGSVDLHMTSAQPLITRRVPEDQTPFDTLQRILQEDIQQQPILIACPSEGSRQRLLSILQERGITACALQHPSQITTLSKGVIGLVILPLERGFRHSSLLVYAEQDLLGERRVKATRKRSKSGLFFQELNTLTPGDFMVHVEHGIGQYQGLETLMVDKSAHDFVALLYAEGARLLVPVENLELLSRYGGEDSHAQVDRLGSAAWQQRKAKLKKKLKDLADYLLKIAAEREVLRAEAFEIKEGLYSEFTAQFPFNETDDQLMAIQDVLEDLTKGKPMDRLICGDVGFGKTEVALRAAFVVAMSGYQVAVAVPTTLLARQHAATFKKRLEGFNLRVAQLSRLVSAKETKQIKEDLAEGRVDVVVGTHALLSKSLSFKRLGLMILDEEQHFGVKQKERLKELQSNVHVLTLTATPIPRTLQLSLTGVREMSLITTPPVDRLAVRTFVTPYDPVILRDALQRELSRGGQIFYVCPRIEDLDQVAESIRTLVPEARMVMVHGQMTGSALESIMLQFAERQADILLATNIIESGLDMPNVNTIVVHNAHLFGLAQLYQLRGRVGRGKQRGYAYLTTPHNRILNETAQKRLEVMQTLDTLGAGFQIASHDMDIRGAGNLLGEEQSGHIREVGVELYQQMLEDAVMAAKARSAQHDATEAISAHDWSPQVNLGIPVLIPDTYVQDLNARLSLYRRLSTLSDDEALDDFAVELVDRFGPLPPEVENLMVVLKLKSKCRAAHISKLDAGETGIVLTFHQNQFPNPGALIQAVQTKPGYKLRPDQKLVILMPTLKGQQKLNTIRQHLDLLVKLAS